MTGREKSLLFLGSALVGIFLVGNWWIQWPRSVVQDYVALASGGNFQEANELLEAPSAIQLEADGRVQITDHKGKQVVLTAHQLPLLSGQAHGSEAPDRNLMDVLLARDQFAMAASDVDPASATSGAPLFMTVERGGNRIDRVD